MATILEQYDRAGINMVVQHTGGKVVRFCIYFEGRANRLAVRLDMVHEKKRHKG